ncbi:MAG: HAMP domain-containing sensor histidine kinase, partial [Alphaproteobacteria bacterium]
EQALLDRNEALETADRLKSEFVANVSYELRTPLNTIMGFAEILNNQYFGELNRRQAEYSRGLLESSQQLMALINDILDLDEAVVDEILANVVTLSKERAREHGLEIKASSSDQAGTVVCDDRRIRQALFNVVSNAIKFTPPDGRIEITARRSDQDMVFVVSDTGIGIPADEQTRVFEKFERGSQYIRRPTGAGLGLALVRKLVELHDGRVELFSEQGKGTTVTIYLPLRPPAAATDVAGFAAGSLAVGANTDAAGR